MAKGVTAAQLETAWGMHQAGKGNKEIMEATGLNYSQMWYDRIGRCMHAGTPITDGRFTGVVVPINTTRSDTATAAAIAQARADGQSWGLIAVRCQLPESRVRRNITAATALDSKGLRIGGGGRYVADDPRLYTGADRAQAGTELVPTVPVLAQVPQPDAVPVRTLPATAAQLAALATPAKAKRTSKKATPKA